VGAGATITKDVGDDQLVIERSRQKAIPGWKKPTKKEAE
jgi:bifunctional UDP-N-acetylglucosamine pyrophosphorylase/glucosamine-1-phosphate N-acetyltransferase